MATEAETKDPISEEFGMRKTIGTECERNRLYEIELASNQRAATATDNSSILHETTKDEALHPVAVGLLDISKGEILVESPIDIQCSSKETAIQYAKTVSQELENEGPLTSNGNHIEAKDEVIAVNERTTDESTSHDGLQHTDQDNNNVNAQATKFDMLEASEAQSEHNEGKTQVVTDMEKFKRVDEDKHIKIEAKTGILNDESTNDIDSISSAEPSEKESTKDPPEIMIKDLGTAEGDDLESSIDAVPEDPVAEKLEGGEDKHVKIEAENGNCSDDKTNDIDSIPMADPSEKQNRQQPLEETAKEDTKPAKDESEQGKLETALDEVPEEPEKEELEKATEDMDAKIREKTRICKDERDNAVDSISAAEPSKEENRQEPLGVTTKEDLEPAEDAPESGELQSPLNAVPGEPEASMLPRPIPHGVNEKHETETTSEEEVVVNIEESSPEDEKKYEPIEKVASELPPEYQNTMTKSRTKAVTANETNEKNVDEKVGDLPIAQDIITETIGGSEMPIIAASEETIHAADDNIEQIPRETEQEILDKISDIVSENQSCEEVADAETTNFISDDGATLEKEIDPLCTSKASMKENTENAINAEDTNNIDSISANEDEAQSGPDIEKFERANEDKNIKIESENGIFNYESTNDIDSISDAEASEKENKNEPLEMVIENLESAEVDKLESPLDAVPQEPEAVKLEKLNEDNHDKIEAETGRLNNGSNNDIDSISMEETSEKRNTQEPLEETAMEDLEPEKEEPEHGELERTLNAVPDETENEKLERGNEDKNVKVEAETRICDDADSISVIEFSDKENRQEPLEITAKEDPEPAEEVPEQGKLESPLDAVPEEAEASMLPQDGPESCGLKRKEEKETTRKEELIMNGEESSPQDEPKYKQIKEAVFNLLPEYQNMKISDQGEKTKAANEESESSNEIDVVKRIIPKEDNKHEKTTNSACEDPNQNDSNMNTRSDEFRNDIETAKKESEISNEHDTVEGTKYEGGEIREDSTNSISKELGQNNDKDSTLIKPEAESDSERASQLSQEHCNDAIADSEIMNRDVVTLEEINGMDKEIDSFSTSHASGEDNTGAATDPTKAIEQIPTANNENEDGDRNMLGETELTVEKDIYEKPEENRSVESEATPGMNFHEEKATEKLDDSNQPQQGKESSAAVKESAADETLTSALQEEKWEDKLENPPREVSWEATVAEESTHPPDVEKKDPPQKHEECFATKDEAGHTPDQAVVGMDTEDPTSLADGSNTEYIHDVVSDKAEETANSACGKQTQETINASIGVEANGQGKELIEKLEPVSNSVSEDKNQEIVSGKESSMIENSTSDCILKDMISETVEANDDKVNVIDEASLNKDFDERPETHGEVGRKNGEDPNSVMEDQIHPATFTEEKLEADVSVEEKETQQLNIIPESLAEDKCQKETSESDAIKINNSTDDEDPETMIPGVADLDEDAETAKENDEANVNTDKGDSSDEHTSIVPTLTDQVSEHEDASKTESGKQMYQAIDDKGNVEVDIHKEMADSEEPENITESVPNDYNQGDLSEPKSMDNSAHNDNLDKVIPETVDHNDDPETAEVKDEDVLEKDIAYVSDTHELLKKPSYDGVGKKHGDADQLTNTEDNKEAIVQEEKEKLETNLELVLEDQSQDAISETESAKLEKAPNLDKDAECSDVIAENASDATSESKLEETMVGNNCELESDNKLESTKEVEKEEVSREKKTEDIVETSLSTVNINHAEVISENQIEGNNGATSNADSENIGCEETQKFGEAIPEVADRDQTKERCDGDDNTKNETTVEEVKVSEVVQNFQPLLKIEAEAQISEDVSQVMKVDAYECKDYEENGECKENKNTSHMTEKCVSKGNEEAKDEILDAVTSTPFNEADGNLQGDHGEQEIQEDNRTRDGVPNEEVDSEPKIKESEDREKEIITISDINLPDIPTSNEEAGQVENAHENAGDSSHEEHSYESIRPSEVENEQAVDSSYGDQIHESTSTSEVENSCDKAVDSSYEEQVPESISLCEDANPEPPIKETVTEDHEGNHASMNNEQEHEELSGKGVCENDKISEEDRTDDGRAFRSSLLAQEVEGAEQHKADGLISEQKTEAFEPEQNQEAFNACPGVSSNKFDKPNATEVDCLSEEMAKGEEETNSTDEKAKDADLVSQMDMETMGDLHANEASLDKNLQDASVVVPEEKILSTPEDNSKEVRAISNNENKEEQDVQTSLQKEDPEDKPQEKENEMQTDESSNTSKINKNVSFKGKETIENDSEKKKLNDAETEISPNVVLEDPETATGSEDNPESETEKQITEDNSEEYSLKDRDMKLVESEIELEPGNQSNKSICTTEKASPIEEGLVDDVAQVDLQNEGSHCKTDGDLSIARELAEESIDMEGQGHHLYRESAEIEAHEKAEESDGTVTQNEETEEGSEMLNIKLQEDAKELVQLEESSNTLVCGQDTGNRVENIEKNVVSKEDAIEAAYEHSQVDETEAKKNNEADTDTVPNVEVKEYNHQPSNQSITKIDASENQGTSPIIASPYEETKKEVTEKFSKISDYWPVGYSEEASDVDAVDTEHPEEIRSIAEQPTAVEKFTFTSADSTAASEIGVKAEESYVAKASELDPIYKEGRDELKEVSDSVPKEDMNENIGSANEHTEDKEKPCENYVMQEPQVNQPEVVAEAKEPTDKASSEVEPDNLQEEKQQTGRGELPASHFLMKYILQEEDDTLKGAGDKENEDVPSMQNEGDEQNDVEIPKQEETCIPLSNIQLTEETSIPEDNVGSEKIQDSSELVQAAESYDVNKTSEITVLKHDASPQSTLDKSTSGLAVNEDKKDELATPLSQTSTHTATDDGLELISTEKSISEIIVESEEHCMEPDLVPDEKIQATVFEETVTEKEVQKNNKILETDADVSIFGKAKEEDILQKEVGKESKERSQDFENVEASCAESDRQSTMYEDKDGDTLETKSEDKKVECGEAEKDIGHQVQILNNDSNEELKLSASQNDEQIDLVTGSNVHAPKMTEKFMEDEKSSVSIDREQVVERTSAKVDENKTEEHKPDNSGCNATTVETRDAELKPTQKRDQTSKSFESSTTDDHKLRETSELQSKVIKVESGEKQQDVMIDQNQAQMKNGSSEEMKPSESQKVQQSDVAIESNVQGENQTVKTTDTKVYDGKTDDEKDQKEEEDECNPEEYGHDETTNVEDRDAELKPTPKKSHGIYSKVKHSIAKVKKAITGKSSNSKTLSATKDH